MATQLYRCTGAAGLAEVGVTLTDGRHARTLLRVTLRLAPTAREPVLTYEPPHITITPIACALLHRP